MIRFDNVCKELNGKAILNGVDFQVREGEIFVIVGPSGAGKSVTLKHMVRLMTPDSGNVLVQGESISSSEGRELERLRKKFGYLFQGGALLAWLSVVENVALPLRENTTMSSCDILEKAHHTLKQVGLGDDAEKLPSEISGGMRKRAGLARAIIMDPKIVLYDEPTSGLDPVTARTIDALIDRMRREVGVTSIVVTHDLHSALTIGSRIALLFGGRLVELATPEAFIQSDNEEARKFLASQFITQRGPWETQP